MNIQSSAFLVRQKAVLLGKHDYLALLQQAVPSLGTVTENSNKNLQEVNFKTGFYMAQSVTGQSEANPAF